MKKILEMVLLCLMFFLFCYLLFMQFTNAVILSAIFGGVLIFKIIPILDRVVKKEKELHEIHQLATHFIIQLGATPSLFESFVHIKVYLPLELQNNLTEEMELKAVFECIQQHYRDVHLQLFFNLLLAYDDEGGNYLETTEHIMFAILYAKHWFMKMKFVKRQKLFNLISLWGLSFVVFIYLRFGLSLYYLLLLKQSFMFVVFLIMLGFIISIFMGFKQYGDLAKGQAYEN